MYHLTLLLICASIIVTTINGTKYNGVEHQHIGNIAYAHVSVKIQEAINEVIGEKYLKDPRFKNKILQPDNFKKIIELPNGLHVSFGDAVALAGDFYGLPEKPISLGKDNKDKMLRFYDAYKQFSVTKMSKSETPMILKLIKIEDAVIKKFKQNKKLPSDAWKTDKLGFEHEMSFARVTRSDKKLGTKMLRVLKQQAETTKDRMHKNQEIRKAKAEMEEKKKTSSGWAAINVVKRQIASLHQLAVDKTSQTIDVIASKLGQFDDLLDKDARYLSLAKVNFDHFMPNSVKVYKAGHKLALASAVEARRLLKEAIALEDALSEKRKIDANFNPAEGKIMTPKSNFAKDLEKNGKVDNAELGVMGFINKQKEKLKERFGFTHDSAEALIERAHFMFNQALALDAMSCHFLTDMFAGGHVRTPRLKLHEVCREATGALLSKCSHDQDNKLGLHVENSIGSKWFALGDSMYFNGKNKKNRNMARRAVVESIQEIIDAFKSGKVGPIPSAVSKTREDKSKVHMFSRYNLKLMWALEYLNDRDNTGYSSQSIQFNALQYVPDVAKSLKLTKRPPMFKVVDSKLYARREESRFNPSVGGRETAYHFVPLTKNRCELELIKQKCKL